jgi:hypothetical protein
MSLAFFAFAFLVFVTLTCLSLFFPKRGIKPFDPPEKNLLCYMGFYHDSFKETTIE